VEILVHLRSNAEQQGRRVSTFRLERKTGDLIRATWGIEARGKGKGINSRGDEKRGCKKTLRGRKMRFQLQGKTKKRSQEGRKKNF